MLRTTLAAAIAGLILVSPLQAEFRPPLAITNARVVAAPGQVIEKATIVIVDGRITAVAPQAPVPAGAVTFDASELTVYPGFICALSHAGISESEPTVDQRARFEDDNPDVRDGPQSATVRAYRRLVHPHWRAETLIDLKELKADELRRVGFTAALVAPKSAILAGQSAALTLGDLPLRRALLRSGVAMHAEFTTGQRGGRRGDDDDAAFANPRYPTTLMGAMALFRQVMLDAAWQHDLVEWSRRNPTAERPATDVDLDALEPARAGRQPVVFAADRENEIHRALDMAAEFKLRPIIAGGREAWKVADRLKRENVPVILNLKWSPDPEKMQRERGRGATSRPASPPATLADLFDRRWESQPWEPRRLRDERLRLWHEDVDNAKRLHEAGVAFSIGLWDHESPDDWMKNLRLAIERGLPEEAALAALTLQPARLLSLERDLGKVAPQQLGNLVLASGPLADKQTRVRAVVVEGTLFPLNNEDTPEARRRRSREERDRRNRDPRDEEEDRDADSPASASAPATSQPDDGPDFAVEIEADRKPRFTTGGNLLIRGATLLTITQGDQPNTDLLIQGGRITQIGKQLAAPPGVTVLDLPGYFVLPGIIDPHSHMCSDGGLNEFSLSVTCEVRVRDVIDHRDVAAYRALAGGCTTIHTMHGSANTIGGQNATLRLKYGRPIREWLFTEAPPTVKFALGENVKQANFGTRGSRFPNTRMGVEAVMRRSFDAAVAYQAEREAAKSGNTRPIRRDLRLEALADILDGKLWVHCHCYRADEVLRLLAVAEDFGFRISVLQHILEGYRVIPEIVRHGCGASTFADWWGYKIEAYGAVPHNAARMTQGGVNATVNSDSPELVRHLNLEAAKSLHYGGLAANDALRLCTLNGAEQLGVDKHVGSIETGKFADLAIFNGHPLDTFGRCVVTLIDGEVYYHDPAIAPGQAAPAPRAPREFRAYRPPIEIARSKSNAYLIRGATIVPVSLPPIADGFALFQDGRIVSIGPSAPLTLPPETVTVDAAGLRLYPGLIDVGCNLGLAEIDMINATVDANEIGTFQPDLSPLSAFNPFSAPIDVTRSVGITRALLWPGGGVSSGQAALVRLLGWSMPEARDREGVALCVRLPSLPIERPRDGMTPEQKKREREQREEHAKGLVRIDQYFRKAKAYAAAPPSGPAAPGFDRALQALVPYVTGQRPVLFAADSYKEICEALEFARYFGLRPIVYGGLDAWKLADRLAAEKVDVIITRTMLYQPEDDPVDSNYRNPARLAAAGVRFCFSAPDAHLSKLLPLEAGMAVAHGLDEERALRALTADAAAILGMADRLGALEPGKVADAVLCTDTPMQASNHVVGLFIDGQPVDLSDHHTRMDAQFRTRPTPTLAPAPNLRGRPALRSRPGA